MKTRHSRARMLLGPAVSLVLLVLLLRTVHLEDLGAALASADLRFVVPAVALYFVGALLRSVRWGLLLSAGTVRTSTLFQALIVGFTVNNLLPVRMGELARAYLLARWSGVRYSHTLASVVIERVLDGLALVVLLLVALMLVANPPAYLGLLGLVAGGVFCAGAALVAVAALRPSLVSTLARRGGAVLPPRFGERLERAAEGFAQGMELMREPDRLAKLFALSLLAWLVELSLFYVLMLAFPFPSSLPIAMLAGTVANFATLVPSGPAYVGTFDGALAKVLVDTTGIGLDSAAAYALLVHAVLFFPVVALGLAIVWRSHLSLHRLTEGEEATTVRSSTVLDSTTRA